MSINEWKYELQKANDAYDREQIDKETYDTRLKFAIYKIWEEGDKESAERISKAHGYALDDIISEVGAW